MWIVYILELNNKSLYTGITNDLVARLKKHETGKGSKYVRSHLPFRLVYSEEATDRSQASKRENQIKKLSRAKKLDLIHKGERK